MFGFEFVQTFPERRECLGEGAAGTAKWVRLLGFQHPEQIRITTRLIHDFHGAYPPREICEEPQWAQPPSLLCPPQHPWTVNSGRPREANIDMFSPIVSAPARCTLIPIWFSRVSAPAPMPPTTMASTF